MSFKIVHRAGPYKVRVRRRPRLMYWVEGPGTACAIIGAILLALWEFAPAYTMAALFSELLIK